jgi:hypothetical protein
MIAALDERRAAPLPVLQGEGMAKVLMMTA